MEKEYSRRVLIVDDNEMDSYLATHSLLKSRNDLLLRTFSNGRTALAYLQSGEDAEIPIACLILDVNMPVIDGLELLQILQDQKLKRFPVVMMTSLGKEDDRQKSQKLGASGFYQKPMGYNESREFYQMLMGKYCDRMNPLAKDA
ncbi:MAG: response regulator [Bacteroidia bacterium]|nr:response regulator [Bacteroidia bacterium]